MNEYQELRPKKIDLVDLMFYCLEKWRWIIGAMLVFAVIGGAYEYKSAQAEEQAWDKSVAVKESEIEEKDNVEKLPVEYFERAIKETEYSLNLKEDYLNQSIVMQLDPYHISTVTLNYRIECEGDIGSLLSAYSSYVSGGGFAEGLYIHDDGIPIEDLQYLVKFNSDLLYLLEEGAEKLVNNDVFQIQIRLPDEELCETYLNQAEKLMESYESQLKTELSQHSLVLLYSSKSGMVDMDIQQYQSEMRTSYSTTVQSLQTLRTQMSAIPNDKDASAVNPANPIISSIKYVMIGLIFGACCACFVIILFYLTSGKLQNMNDFVAEYEMPLLGRIRDPKAKGKLFGFIDTWIFRLKEGAYAQIGFEEQIKMSAANVQASISRNSINGELKNIMLAGTMVEKDVKILCDRLSSELQGVTVSTYAQILFQASALKELANYDGILFLEKKGVSDSQLIEQEIKAASDRNVKVLGAIVLI